MVGSGSVVNFQLRRVQYGGEGGGVMGMRTYVMHASSPRSLLTLYFMETSRIMASVTR